MVLPRLQKLGPQALAVLRAQGKDPTSGGEAGRKRGQANARRARERAEWQAVHGDGAAERAIFRKEILPRLSGIPVRQIARAAGISLRYASMIRRGLHIPHPLHYAALERLSARESTAEPKPSQ